MSQALSAYNSISTGMNYAAFSTNSTSTSISAPTNSVQNSNPAHLSRQENLNNLHKSDDQRDDVNISASAASAYANRNNLDVDMRDFVEARRLEESGSANTNVSDDMHQFVDDRRVNIDMNRQAFSTTERSGIDSAMSSEANLQASADEQIRQFTQNRTVDFSRSEQDEERLQEARLEENRLTAERQARVDATSDEIQNFVSDRSVEIEVNSDTEYAKSFASNVLYDRYFSADRLNAEVQEELVANTVDMTA